MPTRIVALAVSLDHVLSLLCLAPSSSLPKHRALLCIRQHPYGCPDHVPSRPTSQALSAVVAVAPTPSALQSSPPNTWLSYLHALQALYQRRTQKETDSRNEVAKGAVKRSQKGRALLSSSPACNRCLNANCILTLNT